MADELPLGAHLSSQRLAYVHHGIYVGNQRVIHYGGYDRSLRRHPVEEVSLAQFARGQACRVQSAPADADRAATVVRRARSRLGEDRHRLLSNNCEHFCHWCLDEVARSEQAEAWQRRINRLCATLRAPLRRLAPPRSAPAAP